jgi:oligoendopeptidase F
METVAPDISALNSDPEYPRRYLAPGDSFGEWSVAEPYYRELNERDVTTRDGLETWLMDWSELESALSEERTVRYVQMTCQTDDEQRKARYLHFIEQVAPQCEPWSDKLRRKLNDLAQRFDLPQKRYEVLLRSVRNSIALFREENIPLQVEDAKLAQQYGEVTGAMTIRYREEEMTLQRAARFLEEPDRKLREEVWGLIDARYLQDAARIDELYLQMVATRTKIARNAGFRDYREFAFREKERFDYSPEHCLAFHDAIERVVVPAAGRLAAERKKKLGSETLRPWDMDVDPDGRAPLRPFDSADRLADGCSRIFHQVNDELGGIFDTMRLRQMLDLANRKGKQPGGYQETFNERRLPFIFMNAVGTERDVETLLHEGGHAFHTWSCRGEPLIAYRNYPIEFAEVASMGMECLSLPHLGEFYGEDANRSRKRFFEGIINFLPYMATVDALQHYVYAHTDVDPPAQRLELWKDEWARLTRRFVPHIDRSGLDATARHSWHRKLHLFQVPFYYVEYGIAQLGALQVWMNAGCPGVRPVDRDRYDSAVALYRNGLTLGGSRPLPELFEAAGCRLDFSERTLRPLIEAVMEEIGRL